MRRLIINADDFGMTAGVNRAIIESHRLGVLTSATIMAGAQEFSDAVTFARANVRLGIGCHVVLVDGAPLTDPNQVRSLAPEGERFPDSIGALAARALAGRIVADEVEAEAIAQFRKVQANGLSLSHFDTHKHAHIFPAVAEPLLRAARTCGIPAVRNPFTARLPWNNKRQLWKRSLQTRMTLAFQKSFRSLVAKAGLKTTDGTVGIVETGSLDQGSMVAMVETMPEGTWELVCHPGYDDADLARARTRLRASREIEKAVLVSPETREVLQRNGIQLISYWDL